MVPLLPPEPVALPALPGISVDLEDARSILRPQRDESLGFGFALSPYRGCTHGCQYCYLREYPHPRHDADPWGSWVAPKMNAAELLWRERHRLHNKTVFMSTGTDPYQPIEKQLGLARACLEVLQLCPTTRVLVHTRSALVLRDLDLLKAFGSRLWVGLSIPTDDDTVRQVLEPRAPAIPTRWATAERLAAAGIAVQISATPLLPMADPAAYGRRVRDCGAQKVWVGRLRLLKNDPVADILARHGWLKALTQEYADMVREILAAQMPPERKGPRRRVGALRASSVPRFAVGPRQPGLFDCL